MDPDIYGNLVYAKSGIPYQRIKRIWSWDNHLHFGGEKQLDSCFMRVNSRGVKS